MPPESILELKAYCKVKHHTSVWFILFTHFCITLKITKTRRLEKKKILYFSVFYFTKACRHFHCSPFNIRPWFSELNGNTEFSVPWRISQLLYFMPGSLSVQQQQGDFSFIKVWLENKNWQGISGAGTGCESTFIFSWWVDFKLILFLYQVFCLKTFLNLPVIGELIFIIDFVCLYSKKPLSLLPEQIQQGQRFLSFYSWGIFIESRIPLLTG